MTTIGFIGAGHIGSTPVPVEPLAGLDDARPAGAPRRRGLAVFADDAGAAETVAGIVDAIGFDPVVVTPLSEGWRIQRDTPGYGLRRTADELRTDLANAKRYRDL